MDIIFFYLIACLPLIVAGVFLFFNKKVNIVEAIILVAIGFMVSGIFHWCGVSGMTDDVETWSGQITASKKISRWQEGYDKEIYRTEYYYVNVTKTRTVGTGKNSRTETYTVSERRSREVFDHLEYRTRWHDEKFDASDTLNRSYSIDQGRYEDIISKFGATQKVPGNRSNWGYRERNNHMIGGDPNDYVAVNKNCYVYAVTDIKSWENKVKACPSVFSYVKVTEPMLSKLFQYPKNEDKWTSDRLVGAGSWNIVEWDKMNSRLGPNKKVNVIAVNFGINADQELASYQEALWIGGKKNDLVICFGGGTTATNPKWCHTFGWTEKELVKRNIDTIILEHGINADSMNLLEKEINANYEIKEWKKFDYLTVEVPSSYFMWCLIVQTIIIIVWIFVALNNENWSFE